MNTVSTVGQRTSTAALIASMTDPCGHGQHPIRFRYSDVHADRMLYTGVSYFHSFCVQPGPVQTTFQRGVDPEDRLLVIPVLNAQAKRTASSVSDGEYLTLSFTHV